MVKHALFVFLISISLCSAQNKKELVTSVLILEAANQGERGMQAVFEVLLNRAKSSKIESIYKEARKPKQFSCLNKISDETAITRAKKSPVWPTAWRIVSAGRNENLVRGATHYYADWIAEPPWAKGRRKMRLGNHIFVY